MTRTTLKPVVSVFGRGYYELKNWAQPFILGSWIIRMKNLVSRGGNYSEAFLPVPFQKEV
jgi:hypothetical protein